MTSSRPPLLTTFRLSDAEARRITRDFHELYYDAAATGGTWKNTYWLGVPTQKSPLDLWIYQELLWSLRPGLIIETGTAHGGSALFLASVCDAIGFGTILTVDIRHVPERPSHPRIKYLVDSSCSETVVAEARGLAADAGMVAVILDSDHSRDWVLRELRTFAPLVPVGGYIVVEDTNINGNPVLPDFGPGPREAVEEFLKESDDFEVDYSMEKLLFTMHPGGFLRRRS
jgi:cephalosporin hydroxylase